MICLDTCVLAIGVKDYSQSPSDNRALKAHLYLEHLSQTGSTVMVPTIAVSEYLSAYTEAEVPQQTEALAAAGFLQPAFDAKAAHMAAVLHARWQAAGYTRSPDLGRQAFKMDTAIAAVAVVNGAKQLVTENPKDFRNLLHGTDVKVITIPAVAIQASLGMIP